MKQSFVGTVTGMRRSALCLLAGVLALPALGRVCLPDGSVLRYVFPSDDEGPHAPRRIRSKEQEQIALALNRIEISRGGGTSSRLDERC